MKTVNRLLWQRADTSTLDRYPAENALPRMKLIGINADHAVVTCTLSVGSAGRSLPVSLISARLVAKTTITTGMFPRKQYCEKYGAKCLS